MLRTAIYPGSFDPLTLGHADIILRALKVVDRLVIGVAGDSGKEPLFDLQTRVFLVQQALEALGERAARAEVAPFEGLLVDFARAQGATLLIRGLRAVSDFEYEFQMASVNTKIAPDIETVFLTAADGVHFISSRFVKQIARLGGDVSPFVSSHIAAALRAQYNHSSPSMD